MEPLLFNPGPTNVSQPVKDALLFTSVCHREPSFNSVLKSVNQNIVEILNGHQTHSAVLFAASGTGCNEAIISSIHGKILLIKNGKYSKRLEEIINLYQIPLITFSASLCDAYELSKFEKVLSENDDVTHISVVHHETTTGIVIPLRKIGELARRYNKHLVVDAVSSLGGHEIDLQRDNVTFCSVSANKCLQGLPGVSFVIGRTEAFKSLKNKSRTYYFDLYKQWEKSQNGETPFTSPVQLVYALNAALIELKNEGINQRIQRYRRNLIMMKEGLVKLGFELIIPPNEFESNYLISIKIPNEIDYWKLRDFLKDKGIVIYSSNDVIQDGRFRIATLGNLTVKDIEYFLKCLKEYI